MPKWEYDVMCPMLPPGATSPVMDYGQMRDWLNGRAADGWEFVSYAQTRWANGTVQEWWIFRRPAVLQRLAELPPARSGVITAAPRLTNEEDTKALWLTRRLMPGTIVDEEG